LSLTDLDALRLRLAHIGLAMGLAAGTLGRWMLTPTL
jgi:hypothetical protein